MRSIRRMSASVMFGFCAYTAMGPPGARRSSTKPASEMPIRRGIACSTRRTTKTSTGRHATGGQRLLSTREDDLLDEVADPRVRVDAKRVGQRPAKPAVRLDRVEDRHVVGVRDALESVTLGDRHLARRERRPRLETVQLAVLDREMLAEAALRQLVHHARERDALDRCIVDAHQSLSFQPAQVRSIATYAALPPRLTRTRTSRTFAYWRAREKSCAERTGCRFTSWITSPGRSPASEARLPGETSATTTPCVPGGSASLRPISGVISRMPSPSVPGAGARVEAGTGPRSAGSSPTSTSSVCSRLPSRATLTRTFEPGDVPAMRLRQWPTSSTALSSMAVIRSPRFSPARVAGPSDATSAIRPPRAFETPRARPTGRVPSR